MRPTVVVLTTIGLGLAATTAYLAYELRAARQELAGLRGSERDAARAAPAMTATATKNLAPAVQATPAAAMSLPANDSSSPRDATRAQSEAAMRAATLARNAWVRTWLDDPEKRAKVLSDSRKNHEREVPRQLLDLDDDEYNRLLDTLAAIDLRYAEAMYRCNIDPACDVQTVISNQMQANKRELNAQIGADEAQRLENYRDNFMERNSVATFRSGLPDSMHMTDAQAEKLSDALGDERRRMLREWQQRGEQISSIASMYGSLSFPNTMQDVGQRVAEVTEFQRRQRDRAAELLTSAQLEIFTKQQEQRLEIARGSWEYEEQQGNTK